MATKDSTEKALRRLQELVRRGRDASARRTVRSGRVPADIATDAAKWLYLVQEENDAFHEVQALLLADPRFEHLERKAADAVWRFICLAVTQRSQDHVAAFMAEHGRTPQRLQLYIPVESLNVESEQRLGAVRLLPLNDPALSPVDLGFPLEPPLSAVIAVEVVGTDGGRMSERGRAVAAQALRVLRVGLREHREIADRQLRFRLSHTSSFGQGRIGWQTPPDAAWELSLGAGDFELVEHQPLSQLAGAPVNPLQRQAQLALEWIERALLATEQTVELLYLFFALEALLGDKQEGLKAPMLAFRRALLSTVTRGSFSDPGRVYGLYAEVRSAAVHGENAPQVERREFESFRWDVRQALNEFLEFGENCGARRRSHLISALQGHSDAPKLSDWLRRHGHPEWRDYLDSLNLPTAVD